MMFQQNNLFTFWFYYDIFLSTEAFFEKEISQNAKRISQKAIETEKKYGV